MPRHNAYRDGKVHVCERLCETCIFKAGTPIPPERVQQMVDDSREQGTGIICHSTLNTKPQRNAICRGYYERHGNESTAVRAAVAFDVIKFVEVPTKRE